MPSLPSWMQEAPPPPAPVIDMMVAERQVLADGVIALELCRHDGGEVPTWEPGAHIDVHLPEGAIRQYSLCGSQADRNTLRIAILREAEGRGASRYLHDVTRIGDLLKVGGPRNNFPLEPSARHLFIAGGIGITPMVPMISQLREEGREWSLLYGGRSLASMAFLSELEGNPNVTVVPEDKMGLLDLVTALARASDDTHVYCCGPEPLLHAVEDASADWPQGALHVERFKARDDLPDDDGREFEVVLRRSGMTLRVPPGQSILDAVAEAGVAVPSACREGTCGTCETAVLEGEPEHRDSVLTPTEQKVNDCVMICCSRARSERLVLDL